MGPGAGREFGVVINVAGLQTTAVRLATSRWQPRAAPGLWMGPKGPGGHRLAGVGGAGSPGVAPTPRQPELPTSWKIWQIPLAIYFFLREVVDSGSLYTRERGRFKLAIKKNGKESCLGK